jgi:excisionase family DNA binding protein
MLTVTEASRLLNVHPNTLRRWSNKGIIKTYRIGARADRRFRKDDIDRFLSLA